MGPFCKTMVFAHFLEKYLSHNYYISHADWSWKALNPLGVGFTRLNVKVTRVKMYTWCLLIILRTIYHIAFIFQMLMGLDRDMTHIDIGVIRSNN